jgi:hypothetical protein
MGHYHRSRALLYSVPGSSSACCLPSFLPRVLFLLLTQPERSRPLQHSQHRMRTNSIAHAVGNVPFSHYPFIFTLYHPSRIYLAGSDPAQVSHLQTSRQWTIFV